MILLKQWTGNWATILIQNTNWNIVHYKTNCGVWKSEDVLTTIDLFQAIFFFWKWYNVRGTLIFGMIVKIRIHLVYIYVDSSERKWFVRDGKRN